MEQNGLRDIKCLGAAILQLAKTEAVRRTLTSQVEAAVLKVVNLPGAWLLDTIYTQQLILCGHLVSTDKLQLKAVSNWTHKMMLGRCGLEPHMVAPYGEQSNYGSSDNNRGNQSEHIAWLALEADRCDIVVAMAYHASKIEHEPPDSAQSC